MTVPVRKEDISKQDVLESVDLDLEHPRVFRQPDDVARGRWNAEHTDWGRQLKADVLELANNVPLGTVADDGAERKRGETAFPLPVPDELTPEPHHPREAQGVWPFMELDEEELLALELIPDDAGEYYYAFPFHGTYQTLETGTASPIDGSPLHLTGFDQPGTVMDESGNVFPGEHDGISVDDDGGGWVVPDDVPDHWAAADHVGERFWFRAVYNGRIARLIRSSVPAIAYAYLLTEDESYARTAAIMLDLVAEPFANTAGMVDYHNSMTSSRMHRSGYAVDTLLNMFLDAADVVWPSGELEAESHTSPGMTIAENVTYNLAAEGAYWMWSRMQDSQYAEIFHNGTDRFNRTLMVCSSFAGLDAGFVEWCLDGQVSLPNFLANTVFRDGQYYEMSAQYSQSFRQTAEVAYHLADHSAYPDGRNFFDEPRYELLNVHGPRARNVAGRSVKFGDGPPDLAVSPDPEPGSFDLVLRFYRYTSDEDKRAEYAQLLAEIAGGDPNERLQAIDPQYWDVESGVWPLFNIEETITGFDLDDVSVEARDSELLPGRGFAHFRPDDRFDQGAALRYGPPLSKAHCDQLGLHIYGAGREMSYDPGHEPVNQQRAGFLRQTVAHNTVVVNERSQVPPEAAGGVVNAFASREGYAMVDVADEMAYAREDVETFRRTTAFIDAPFDQSYLVDLFRVDGGDHRDFSFHGLGVDFETDLSLSEPTDGSVASPAYRWDRMEEGGWIPNTDDSNPEPGNGYGFLSRPRTADGGERWSATWSVREDQGSVGGEEPGKMRLTMAAASDREIVVADGPEVLSHNLGLAHPREDIPPVDRIPYVLARDTGAEPSQFVSVIEAVTDEFVVDEVASLEPTGGDDRFDPVALAIHLTDGETVDYVLSTLGTEPIAVETDHGTVTSDADLAMVRVDRDGIQALRVDAGTHVRVDPNVGESIVVQAPGPSPTAAGRYEGRILEVDHEDASVLVDTALPAGTQLHGQQALVDAPEYARNSQYEIDTVEPMGEQTRVEFVETDMTLSRGTVEEIDAGNVIVSPTDFPLTWTRAHYREGRGNEYFDGRLTAVNLETGDRTTVTDADGNRRLTVADASGFSPGDTFVIMDIKAGDEIAVPLSAEIRRSAGGYDVEAPDGVEVQFTG